MNNAIYMGAIMPAILSSTHYSGGYGGGLGLFGICFFTFFIFGMIALVSYIAWDIRELGAFPICIALFFDILLIMIWVGLIFGLN